MKKLFILLIAAGSFFSIDATAQTSNNGPARSKVVADSDEDDDEEDVVEAKATKEKIVYADPTSMDNTSMEQGDGTIIFNDLPLSNTLVAHITDANGNEVASKKVTAQKNVVNTGRLRKGMHFVTLMSESTGKRKSFTLTIE